jgi:hypothetical protein
MTTILAAGPPALAAPDRIRRRRDSGRGRQSRRRLEQADHSAVAATLHSTTSTHEWTSTIRPGLSDFTGARVAAQRTHGIQRPGCTGDCVG